MKLSIIIITWNSINFLRGCLSSLTELMRREDVQIIVVDNGSIDDSALFIKKTYPRILLLELNKNTGVAYARNRGMEKASGKYVFILDNDTIANSEAIEGMEHFMDEHSEVGLCACKLVYANKQVQDSCKRYPGLKVKIKNIIQPYENKYSYSKDCMSKVFEPEYVIGACQFIRHEVLDKIGLLDEKIFYGPEDADFCIRTRNAGWKVYYLPQFSIIHLCQRITNKKLFSKLAMKHTIALFYFYWKHKKIL